ncbi:hypothetical protein V2J09_015772 [Rumex salicifolius]
MTVLQVVLVNGVSHRNSLIQRTQRRKRRVGILPCISMEAAKISPPSRTQRIMDNILSTAEAGGAGGSYSYSSLKRLDQLWSKICSAQSVVETPKQVVSTAPASFSKSGSDQNIKFDVVVCGGTLGIFIATALLAKGLRVRVVERNILRGREQEWNISRKELLELVKAGVLVEEDIEEATSSKFNPNRCGFEGKGEVWVEDILNLGISPLKLIEIMKNRFTALGGIICEDCSVSSICIYEDAAILQLANGEILSSRLVIDAMGNFSPIVKQIRGGRKPDGVCLVVGSCARGFQKNIDSDVIYSSSSVKKAGNSQVQLFWEAFPAGSGRMDRTTYMFTYVDPQPNCPGLEDLLESYWDLMPTYQGVSLDDLEILRVVYGIFPTYRDSPLPAAFDRILQFGDASGIQSPVSFGGFGSLTRHLDRLSTGIYEAISNNLLDANNLSLLNPYMPNLSASWLFQRAMSAKQQSNRLGNPVLRPFLQVLYLHMYVFELALLIVFEGTFLAGCYPILAACKDSRTSYGWCACALGLVCPLLHARLLHFYGVICISSSEAGSEYVSSQDEVPVESVSGCLEVWLWFGL